MIEYKLVILSCSDIRDALRDYLRKRYPDHSIDKLDQKYLPEDAGIPATFICEVRLTKQN
jgi:hypothetical protein